MKNRAPPDAGVVRFVRCAVKFFKATGAGRGETSADRLDGGAGKILPLEAAARQFGVGKRIQCMVVPEHAQAVAQGSKQFGGDIENAQAAISSGRARKYEGVHHKLLQNHL
jgi:hypothetical protein